MDECPCSSLPMPAVRGVRRRVPGARPHPAAHRDMIGGMSRGSTFAAVSRLERVVAAVRLMLSGAGAALALFHLWLFVRQIAGGELTDPALALRWIVAGGLVAPLALLWRRGESLVGRRAIAIWVLAVLLHGPAVADRRYGAFDSPVIPETVTSVLQIAVALAGLGLALAGTLALRRRPFVPALARAARPHVPIRIADRPSGRSFAPRPPPLA